MLSVNILDMKFQRNKMRGKCLAWKRTSKQAWAEIGQAQARFEFELRLKLGDEWVDKYKINVKSTQVEVVVEVWVELGNLSPFSDLFPLKIVQIQMFLELLWKIVFFAHCTNSEGHKKGRSVFGLFGSSIDFVLTLNHKSFESAHETRCSSIKTLKQTEDELGKAQLKLGLDFTLIFCIFGLSRFGSIVLLGLI